MPRGPLRAGLNGAAIRLMAIKDFQEILPQLSILKARDAARRIEKWQSAQVNVEQALAEEKRAMQGTIVGLIRARDFRPLYVSYGCIGNCNVSDEQYRRALNELPTVLKMRLAWMNKPRLLDEYSRCMDWQIANAKQPYPLREKGWPFPEAHEGLEYLIYPQYSKSPQNFLRCEAKNALLFTMLALRAFHLENHRYPKQLSELVPKYLARVPRDSFSNHQPLRYRLAPVRYIARRWFAPSSATLRDAPSTSSSIFYHYEKIPFTLYSIGPNARDDGGTPYLSNPNDDRKRYIIDFHLPDTARADIVAGIN
jgi:hypothetical protein